MRSQIIKILEVIDQTKIKIDKSSYSKHRDEVVDQEQLLLDAFGDNEKLKNLYYDFDNAATEHKATIERGYYRQGFIDGAKVALEICGIEFTDDE